MGSIYEESVVLTKYTDNSSNASTFSISKISENAQVYQEKTCKEKFGRASKYQVWLMTSKTILLVMENMHKLQQYDRKFHTHKFRFIIH